MQSFIQYVFLRAVAVAALALMLALPAARADVVRPHSEPWYQQATAEARQRAQVLFEQAFDKHQQLLRGEAKDLYEQALALWDNPDIRWNLALVLADLGEYLRAHEQLDRTLRWEAALGAERLREVRERIAVLETLRLGRIETSVEAPAAEITLDGQPWLRRAGRRSALVAPGQHYVAARKPGHFPVTQSVSVKAGQLARVALPMDEDRLVKTRRWAVWKPWVLVGAGLAAAAAGAELERRTLAHRDVATAGALVGCTPLVCDSHPSNIYDRVGKEHQRALGVVAASSTALAVGLTLVWLNRPRARRTEARPPTRIELTPMLSLDQAEVSALVRF